MVSLQDAVHVVVGGAVETLRRLALQRPVSEGVHDVVHGGELALAPPLGALPEFVPVMRDLGLVSQRHLRENGRTRECQPSRRRVAGARRRPHLGADLLGEGGAQVRRGLSRRAGPRPHGDPLHLVGRAAGQTVHVVEDGGRGQELVWTA